jgi:acetamidase/formamidase
VAAAIGLSALPIPAMAAMATKETPTVFDPSTIGATHELPSTPATVRVGAIDPLAKPVLEIESGDAVHYPNTWLNWGDEPKFGMTFAELGPIRKRYPAGPFSLVGPVGIRGAEPGDVVECRMLRLRPIDWGWNSAPVGVGALPSEFDTSYTQYFRFDADRRFADVHAGVRVPLAPSQSVMATQPKASAPVSALGVGRYGGMIALGAATAGTSLYLPVEVEGAGVWTGGSWAVVGDGCVDNTAIETAMEDLLIQYVLHKGGAVDGPLLETETDWLVLGYGDDLESALTMALERTMDWLAAPTGMTRQQVYALCSIAASFRVSQYSKQLNTVYTTKQPQAMYAAIPKSIFDAATIGRIADSLRGKS